jgi:formyltetrahydrofolate deformylase
LQAARRSRADDATNLSTEVATLTGDLTEITVIGEDDTGLIARITSLLFDRGINIEDLDQAVQEGVFRMTMHVDASDMAGTREELRADLEELGEDLDLDVQLRFPGDRATHNVAVMVTKESHCLERLLEANESGEIDADVEAIIGNHDYLFPLAEEHGLPFYDIGDESGQPDEDWLLDILTDHDIDLVALARYMRILSPDVVFRYENRIINVHPSLLPAFPGAQAYRQAVEKGVRVAGVTAHYVTTDLDQGPIVAQRGFSVPEAVYRGDPAEDMESAVARLERVGQPLEAEVLLAAIRMHLNDDVVVRRGRSHLRNGVDGYQLGLPPSVAEELPDEPVDSYSRHSRRQSSQQK